MSLAESIDVLDAAHQLITGRPFDADGYDWAQEMQFVHEASEASEAETTTLVDLALQADLADIARAETTRAIRTLDVNESLYRRRMRIEHRAGNLAGVKETFDELWRQFEDFGTEPSVESEALLAELPR
jgi:DNA-binding SARP family transcriptional activator